MNILEMTLSASMLILVIIVIRMLAMNELPKKTFVFLWCSALCKLLIPFSIPFRYSIYTVINRLRYSMTSAATPIISNSMNVPEIGDILCITVPNYRVISEQENLLSQVSLVVVIWIIGACLLGLFFVINHIRCLREYKTALPIDNSFITDWMNNHPIKRNVQIRVSDKITTPLTYGVWRSVVLLPKSIDWADKNRLQYILTHEFVHIRHFDIVTKWLLVAALCMHWFNPLVWIMFELVNRDLEIACDEKVLRYFGTNIKAAYALSLIGMAEQKRKFMPLYICFSRNVIEERIKMIMKTKKISRLSILVAVILFLLTTTAFATTPIINGEMPLVVQEINQGKVGANEEESKVNISFPDLVGRTYGEVCSILQQMGLSFENEK